MSRTIDSRATRRASRSCSGASFTRVGDLRVGHALGRVEHPEPEAGEHEPAHRQVDVGLPQQAPLERRPELAVHAAAIELAAPRHPQRRRFLRGRHELVARVDVVDGPAVRDDVAVEAPLLAQDVVSSRRLAEADSPLTRL